MNLLQNVWQEKMKLPKLLSRSRRGLFIRLLFIGIAQVAVAGGATFLVKSAFDRLMSGAAPLGSQLALYMLGFVGVALAVAGLRIGERAIAERIGQDYVRDIRLALYDHLSRLSPRALQNKSHGALMLRFVGDLTSLRQWVSLGLARLIVGGIVVGGVLLILAWLGGLFFMAIATVLLLGALLTLMLGRRMQDASLTARQQVARLAANLSEKLSFMHVVRVLGQTKRERRRVSRQSDEVREAMVHRARVAGAMRAIVDAAAVLSYGAVLVAGSLALTEGNASPGATVAALTLVSLLSPTLRELGRTGEYWYNAKVARQKINEFFRIPAMPAVTGPAPEAAPETGLLELESVSLTNVLAGVTGKARAGEVTVLIGPNGSGKSSLLAVIAGLALPDDGIVRLAGQEIRSLHPELLYKAVSFAAPDFPLLRGSLRRNLLYRRPDAGQEEIDRVWRLCRIDHLAAQLPNGLDTRIADGGAGLSSGQIQRIALARALLGDPKLLLLDEPDANMDKEACEILDTVLATYSGTVLLVTHRRERILQADSIWYLEGGRLLEAGPPDLLLASGGPAAKFMNVGLTDETLKDIDDDNDVSLIAHTV